MATRTKVGVQAVLGATYLNAFYTTADADERTALGHVTFAGNTAAAFIYGVNSPRPARVKKTRASGRSVSSYADVDELAAAITAGWKLVSPARYRRATNSSLSKAVYLTYTVNGMSIDYAWRMPTETFTALGADFGNLGLKDAAAATLVIQKKLLWGGNDNKPPKAIKKNADGTIVSTFFDPSVMLPAGWSTSSGMLVA